MKLDQLPIEVLSLILSPNNSWIAFELWKTGDRALQAKLAHGGVQEIDLVASKTIKSPPKWPKSLENFQLRSLSIVRPIHAVSGHKELRAGLSQLKTCLKRLTLVFEGAETALFLKVWAPPDTPHQDDDTANTSDEVKHTGLSVDTLYELSDLVTRFVHLEHLKVGGSSFVPFMFNDSFLALLPKSLTSLDLHQAPNIFRFTSFDQLPPHLERIIFPRSNEVSKAMLRSLPPRITDVGTLSEEAKVYMAKNPNLLPNLPFPLLDSMFNYSTGPSIFHQADNQWHPRLQSLTMYSTWSDLETLVVSLPRQLTCLNMQRIMKDLIWSKSLVKTLPPALKTLKIASTVLWNEIESLDWPPLLSSFHLYEDATICSENYHRLPRTIETLDLLLRPLYAEYALFDETHLLTLGRQTLEGSEKENWSIVRQELLAKGQRNNQRDSSKMEALIAEIEKGALYGLPLSITTLKAAELCKVPSRILLPPRLRYLHLKMSDFRVIDYDFWYLFPPQLLDIKLDFDDDEAYWTSIDTVTDLEASSFLQTHQLSVLQLKLQKMSVDYLCASLPRSLREFSLTGADEVQMKVESLETLPLKLERLSLSSIAFECDEGTRIARYFPRHLTSLTLDSSTEVVGADWRNLPNSLTFLHIGVKDVSLGDVFAGPQFLRSARVHVGLFDRNDPVLNQSDWSAIEDLFQPFWRIFGFNETSALQQIQLRKAEVASLREKRSARFGFA